MFSFNSHWIDSIMQIQQHPRKRFLLFVSICRSEIPKCWKIMWKNIQHDARIFSKKNQKSFRFEMFCFRNRRTILSFFAAKTKQNPIRQNCQFELFWGYVNETVYILTLYAESAKFSQRTHTQNKKPIFTCLYAFDCYVAVSMCLSSADCWIPNTE